MGGTLAKCRHPVALCGWLKSDPHIWTNPWAGPRVDNCCDGCKASLGLVSQVRITIAEDQHACPVSTQSISQLKISKVSSETNVSKGRLDQKPTFAKIKFYKAFTDSVRLN